MTARDRTGQCFGTLRVVARGADYVTAGGRDDPRWLCECALDLGGCGAPVTLGANGLLRRRLGERRCMCPRRALSQERAKRVPVDLTGKTFGRLRVLARITARLWRCECAVDLGGCGRETVCRVSNLRSGNTRSCGCARRRKLSPEEQARLSAVQHLSAALESAPKPQPVAP